ncbi:MAG: MotA/TolQ/ExbB proton channel family protein [Verrucomicrobia bacterium]|nr:MotA/TolQ/ExbB proton channel family protein [Verrucomicrobiota bacterium]
MLPELLKHGGIIMWVLLGLGAVAAAVFIERLLHYHREQINAMEFLIGVKNVLKRDNVVEAVSICDATPGPVARMVKTAILNREKGRDGIRDALREAGLIELPRLEEKLSLLATIAQIAPLLGLLGTVLGLLDTFAAVHQQGLAAQQADLAGGVWQALICTGGGLALAIPCYAGYNYLVTRMNSVILDMEKSSYQILEMLTELAEATRPV